MSISYYTFGGDRIALVVRGKTSAAHDPSVMAQHADCVLSTGAPIGFFGEPKGGGGGSSSGLPSSIGGTGRGAIGKSNMSGMNMAGAVYDYRALRREREAYVEIGAAQGANVISTALLIQVTPEEAAAFDKSWAAMAANPGSFHLLGSNCSTHASQVFRESGILSAGIPGLDTPNNLYKQLATERAGKVESVSGWIGFARVGSAFKMIVKTP